MQKFIMPLFFKINANITYLVYNSKYLHNLLNMTKINVILMYYEYIVHQ
jgi:hypothetical protein